VQSTSWDRLAAALPERWWQHVDVGFDIQAIAAAALFASKIV